MSRCELAIIADDLTGACDTALQFHSAGMRAVVAPMVADRSLYEAIPGLLDVLTPTLREEVARQRPAPWAASIAGMDHPYMSEEMLTEARSLPPYEQLPHFKDSYDPNRRLPNGFWAYYTDVAAKSLA